MNEYTNRKCKVGLPSDNKKKRTPQEKINITMGIFFDGTKNNKYNIDHWENIDDSYQGSYTNVASLWDMYETSLKDPNKLIDKVYIEGPGTESPIEVRPTPNNPEGLVSSEKSDSMMGYAYAAKSTGVNAKIERACRLIYDKVARICNDRMKYLDILYLDVFGFSRGAAEARSFISRLESDAGTKTEDYKVCLRQYFKMNHNLRGARFRIRFLGIFDTVSSFHPSFSLSPEFGNDVKELALGIPQEVEKTIHFVAADEYRDYFALTTISSAQDRGIEIIFPGAHSDIGGGYASSEIEQILRSFLYIRLDKCRGNKYLRELLDEGWVTKKWCEDRGVRVKGNSYEIDSSGSKIEDYTRSVKNDYARIPLLVMVRYSHRSSISLKNEVQMRRCELKYKSQEKLRQLRQIILNKALNGQSLYEMGEKGLKFCGTKAEEIMVKELRYQYMHLSAINDTGHGAAKNNKRIIISG